MIKKISSIILLASVFIVMACSSDSDGGSGTKVKYRITTDSGLNISTINYRDADGQFVTVTASNPNEWSKEITVESPFAASVDAVVSNTSDVSKGYNVKIYVNGHEHTEGSGFVDNGDTVTIINSADVE